MKLEGRVAVNDKASLYPAAALGILCPVFQDMRQTKGVQLLQQPCVADSSFPSKGASASKPSICGDRCWYMDRSMSLYGGVRGILKL